MSISAATSAQSPSTGLLLRLTAWAMLVLGVSLFAAYLVFLPQPQLFAFDSQSVGASIGLILYSLATAGSAFIAWGIMLSRLDGNGLTRQQVLRATAIGIGLLGLMRLGTAIFPPPPFDAMIALPIGEFVVFSLLAFKLFRS